MKIKPRIKTTPDNLKKLLCDSFGFAAFRPFQHKVCRCVVKGNDALLVMPTGAGKSLCCQLPGIARGGTTLVISPLIALTKDQATKLNKMGFVAQREFTPVDQGWNPGRHAWSILPGGLIFYLSRLND